MWQSGACGSGWFAAVFWKQKQNKTGFSLSQLDHRSQIQFKGYFVCNHVSQLLVSVHPSCKVHPKFWRKSLIPVSCALFVLCKLLKCNMLGDFPFYTLLSFQGESLNTPQKIKILSLKFTILFVICTLYQKNPRMF